MNSGRSSGIRNTSNDKSTQNSSKPGSDMNSQVKKSVILKLNTNLSGTTHSLTSAASIQDISSRHASHTLVSHSGANSVKHGGNPSGFSIPTTQHHSGYHTANTSSTRNQHISNASSLDKSVPSSSLGLSIRVGATNT